ncbi:hypothetical protein ACIQAS_00615 [Bacillus safensis]|uniref:hypothetical protein n=2 Tax=Bacillus safensis TaxID=561879 RepID=UPI0038243DFB
MNYEIKSSVIDSYEKIFIKNIEKTIKKMINFSFFLKTESCELSISFYEDFLVTIKIEGGYITELKKNSYESFISDSFLESLSNFENLPPRLYRYKNLGLIRFRKEVKESLKEGKIITNDNDVLWKDYNITLIVDKNISLVGVIN